MKYARLRAVSSCNHHIASHATKTHVEQKEMGNLEELAENIKEYGVLEPIIVRPKEEKFEVVVGERRVRASIMAGLKEIPAIIRPLTDRQMNFA